MTEEATTVLRRMATRVTADSAEDPADRRMALGFARAADRALGLHLVVATVRFDRLSFDDALGDLVEGQMLVRLEGPAGRIGLVALGAELRAAVVEMQTTGRLGPKPADPRPPTATDAALVAPLLQRWLADLAGLAPHSPIATAAPGFSPADRLGGLRAARVMLEDCDYFRLTMTLGLGHGDRRSDVTFLWPDPHPPHHHEATTQSPRWAEDWRSTVAEAPVCLTAVLHRQRLPLSRVVAFAPGLVLPLPGVTVHSLRLTGEDGRVHAQARLGQSGGMRAIRIEPPPRPVLAEDAAAPRLPPEG